MPARTLPGFQIEGNLFHNRLLLLEDALGAGLRLSARELTQLQVLNAIAEARRTEYEI